MLVPACAFSCRRLVAAVGLLIFIVLQGGSAAFAQEPAMAAEDVSAEMRKLIDEKRVQVDQLGKSIEPNSENDAALVDTKVKLDEAAQDLHGVQSTLKPRLDEIKGRLDQLGEPPKEGQPAEAPEVTEERNKLVAERLSLNNLVAAGEELAGRATKLSSAINQIRRDLFTEALFEHTDVSVDVMIDAWSLFGAELSSFQAMIGSWLGFVFRFKQVPLASAVMLSLVMALLLLTAEYRLFGALIKRDAEETEPSYMSRLSGAFWSTVIPSFALAAFLAATFFFLELFNVLRPDIAPIVAAIFGFLGFVSFVALLNRAVLSPRMPNWRLVRLSNGGAKALGAAILLMSVVNGLDYVFGAIAVVLSSPVVLTVMKSLLSSAVVGIIIFLMSFMKPVLAADGDPAAPGRPWPRAAAVLLRLVGLGLVLLALVGYVGLARFLATQLIVTGAVAATVYLGILSAQEISGPNRFGETRVGRWVGRRFRLTAVGIDQAGLVAGLLIYAFALAIGIPFILISWGFQPRDLQIFAYRVFTEIQIGTIRISLVGILGGILLFALGLVATRWFQKWFDGNVLARSHVDMGVRNSVRTGAGYLGTAVAGLVGISAAGIDLSSLALVAGALSLGIGFGLQNIVSNFVSGLILLVERPFKVGDWVATGATEGFVRRISVRATEIETFQRQSIIVPNSQLINAAVGNWTHRNSLARVDVPVGVAYDADPRKVLTILKEIGTGQPGVMRNPEPFVIFQGFGPSSLDFQLCVFVPDILDSLGVKNGLRITVWERFRAEGIRIPYQQQDINLYLREADLAAAAGMRTEEEEKGQA